MAYFRQQSGKWRAEVVRRGVRTSQVFPTKDEAERWAAEVETNLLEQTKVSKALAHPEVVKALPPKVLKAMQEVDYTLAEILKQSRPMPDGPGIYFLIREGVVVYIGKTTNLSARVLRHRTNGKVFDAYTFLPCPAEDMDRLEALYIMAYWPIENKAVSLLEDD